jgi:hypothetical protein
MSENIVSTPTQTRCVTSYAARTQYSPGSVHPNHIKVKDAIDIHCHAHAGQQDALDLVKKASRAEMKGILFKSIVGDSGRAVRELQEELDTWAGKEGVGPVQCFAGFVCGRRQEPVSVALAGKAIDDGAIAVWLPVFNHANTIHKVGNYRSTIERDPDAKGWIGPVTWERALEVGHYGLDERGNLKPEYRDIVHLCADRGVALFFGHPTHAEIFELAEEITKIGLERAVIDHPYSPFLDVTVDEMKELSKVGILFNFTFDELSPLLGVDPQIMYDTIREVGVEHFTLSSDAGEPLFPDSVEAMRLIRGYMEAFGLNEDELYTVCTRNPARVVGMKIDH